jgi:hypothetical protein
MKTTKALKQAAAAFAAEMADKKSQEDLNSILKPAEDQVYLDSKQMQSDVITRERLLKAVEILRKDKAGKSNLEKRIINSEQWWKGRHWDVINDEEGNGVTDKIKPKSAWLFNSMMSKHADYVDAYPEPNILPRERGDEEEAKRLSSILPVVLDQCGFEETYEETAHDKLIAGAGIFGIFWDGTKNNGLGDITINPIDPLNIFWDPGVTDIQKSKNLFHVNLIDNDDLEGMYPELKGKLGGNDILTAKYIYDDNVDTTNQTPVVDWYYKKIVNGKKTVQLCKFVNDVVLYSTENDTEQEMETVENPILNDLGQQIYKRTNEDGFDEFLTEDEMTEEDLLNGGFEAQVETLEQPIEGTSMYEKGLYDHGLYPFVIDNMFHVKGTPIGFSLLDVCKSPQEDIDKIKRALLINTLFGALPKFLTKIDGQINIKELLDFNNMFIHFQGNYDEQNLMPIPSTPLNGNHMQLLDMDINEMRETTGNTDVSQGIPTGVTSGSAISALQEAAGKTSRLHNKKAYMAYKKIIEMTIELIRQFYDIPRQFRIIGENGREEYITYSNEKLKMQEEGTDFSGEMQYRLPVFDIEVVPQKQNPYSKNGQNETLLTLYNMGVFNPEMGDQAVALVESMDFNQKQEVLDKIKDNQQLPILQQQIESLKVLAINQAAALDQIKGTDLAQQLAQMFDAGDIQENIDMEQMEEQPMPQGNVDVDLEKSTDHPFNQRARSQAQEVTQPV